MADEAKEKEILEKLAEAVVEYDEDMAKEWSEMALNLIFYYKTLKEEGDR